MRSKTHFYDPLYDLVTFEDIGHPGYSRLKQFKYGFSDSIETQIKAKEILPFLHSFELNRLGFLRQSGFAFLVHPSSTHTRLAHSIGCCHLGLTACRKIMVHKEGGRKNHTTKKSESKKEPIYLSKWLEDRGWKEEFLLALLLHDVGHFPFSHTLESNLEFWQSLKKENRVSHEDLTCRLILGTLPTGDSLQDFMDFRKHVKSQIDLRQVSNQGCQFISQLIERNKSIDKNLLCYMISGDEEFISKFKSVKKLELKLVHELVSGLLDLDRIDHYRRDSYFSGLRFGTNLNYVGLLGGLTLHYYANGPDDAYELRLSPTAIGHALTLLHSKERLVHDCFEDPNNMAFDAMLHRAMNLHVGVSQMQNDTLSDEDERVLLEKAYQLFFLTDDELLSKLADEGNPETKEIVFRIRNRMPYCFVGKRKVSSRKFSLTDIRRLLIDKTGYNESDVIIRPSKHFASKKRPPDDWLNLEYLFDENGNGLSDHPDYGEQIQYFKRIQGQSPDIVWVFTPNPTKKAKLTEKLDKEFPTNIKSN